MTEEILEDVETQDENVGQGNICAQSMILFVLGGVLFVIAYFFYWWIRGLITWYWFPPPFESGVMFAFLIGLIIGFLMRGQADAKR